MNAIALALPWLALQNPGPQRFGSLWDTLVRGGPVMIPLAICSVLALTWTLERSLRLRARLLGSRTQADQLVTAARDLGPAKALEIARANPTVLSRIFQQVFERWSEPRMSLEKSVEDAGSRELRSMGTSLRPFTVITVSAPLLGLLGTVIGIIIAFRDIAASDAMGKPEALATGIAQALVCTASGLAVAIPTQAAYYWFRSRVDRFWRLIEDTGERIFAVHSGRALAHAPSIPAVPVMSPPAAAPAAGVSFAAQATP
jgi:biopolymer transport protein ExbB